MRNYFTFNGHDSRDCGIYISGSGTLNGAGRNYDAIEVPGRDGDLLGVEKRLNNIELTYPAFTYGNLGTLLPALKEVLLGAVGYKRLTDSYHPDEFRLAYFPGPLDVDPTAKRDAAEFDVTFMCKPQRWLLSGETQTTYTAAFTVTNPTAFTARPLLRVNGYGVLTVGSVVIEIPDDIVQDVIIDCATMDCYTPQLVNVNDKIKIYGNEFPIFPAGETGVSFDSTVYSVRVTPRWWRV